MYEKAEGDLSSPFFGCIVIFLPLSMSGKKDTEETFYDSRKRTFWTRRR